VDRLDGVGRIDLVPAFEPVGSENEKTVEGHGLATC
jgi:hypothetical protein